ncbi:MAG: hypothetical protein CMJ78_27590 [Planctomycetaceae bacterium]|nr:hypothetical protein [Planctomycetaceae bacterium]
MPIPDLRSTFFNLADDSDVIIVRFDVPRLNDEENIEMLGEELFSLVQNYHCRKMVINLATVNYLTSSVLGKLITLHRRLHRNDGRMVICELQPTVEDLMSTSKLLTYFNVSSVESEAVAFLKD